MVFNKPVSDMALVTAAGRAKESERSDCLVYDPYAKKLAGDSGMKLVEQFGDIFIDAEAITTRVFDDAVIKFVEGGGTQIVVLGAGVDARPYRLQILRDRSIRWWEMDYEGVLSYKAGVLGDSKPLCMLVRIPTDILEKGLFQRLIDTGLNPELRTLWVAEGVFHYLRREEVAEFLETIHSASSDGSTVFFSALSSSTKSHTGKFEDSMSYLRKMGAPMTFALDDPRGLLESHGYANIEVTFMGHHSAHYGRLPWPPAYEPLEGYPMHWYIKGDVKK